MFMSERGKPNGIPVTGEKDFEQTSPVEGNS